MNGKKSMSFQHMIFMIPDIISRIPDCIRSGPDLIQGIKWVENVYYIPGWMYNMLILSDQM
uniref:ORF60a n=1 Tax=Pinus koraiensis TaxID=88728 RepID=A4QMH5_PINKO|nr:ORF60a [Pinus koraiensis]ABP35302.1 ORF60a [Pinus koraiensis]